MVSPESEQYSTGGFLIVYISQTTKQKHSDAYEAISTVDLSLNHIIASPETTGVRVKPLIRAAIFFPLPKWDNFS